MEVLEHREQRPDLALPQQQALQGVERALPSLGGIERRKRAVRGERVQQRQQGRDGVPQALVERQHVSGDLGADRARVVAVRDLEVRLEEIDDRQVRGRLPVRHGEALEDEPSLGPMGMDELVEEAGLPHAGLPDDGHDLAVPATGSLEGPLELPHLAVAPDEPGEPLRGGGAQARPQGSSPDQLVDLDGVREALERHGAERRDLDEPLGQAERAGGDQRGPRACELLHAPGQVRRLAHRRVVHVEIAADRADDDLARVEPDPDLHVQSLLAPQLLGIPADGVLHGQGRVAGAHRVVLVRQRRAEERHDPVAQHLVHGALVAMDGLHQPFQDRVEQTLRLLGIAVGQELH